MDTSRANETENLRIPDEYASGGQPLPNVEEEGIALGLFGLARWNAQELLSLKEFLDSLHCPTLDEGERKRMIMEVTIFNLYISSLWLRGNYKNFQSVLDRMYFFLHKSVSDNSLEFMSLTKVRYQHYEKSYKSNSHIPPIEELARTATMYFYGTEELTPEQGIVDVLTWVDRVPEYAGLVKEFIEKKAYLDKSFISLILKA